MASAKVTIKIKQLGQLGIELSEEELAAAFTEWERRYREEPERFQSEAEKLLHETPETYGQACAPYFIKILLENKYEENKKLLHS